MSDLIRTKELSEVLGLSRKTVLERARKEGWPCVEKSGGLQFVVNRLPVDIRLRLSGSSGEGMPSMGGHAYTAASEKSRNTAAWRSALLLAYRQSGLSKTEFVDAYNSGLTETVIHGKLGNVSVPTFYRWLKDWRESGASGITPRYGMSRGGAGESLSETEKELLARFWLVNTQPSAMHALRLMKQQCPYSRCTYSTALRFLNSIPALMRDAKRLGMNRAENLHLPYIEQNVRLYRSLDKVVSDHHVLDCVCVYQGKLIRPWITTMQDYRSGKILGWCVTVQPSSLSIIVAYYRMCIAYGVPKELLFDNGQDYRSKLLNGWSATIRQNLPEGISEETEVRFSGIFSLIGSDVHFTRTYNGKSKGRQERYFRILGEYLAKDFGTYVGSDSRTRPEDAQLMFRSLNGVAQRKDIPDFRDFQTAANSMVMYINDKFESHGIGMDGKTRSQVFLENLDAESVRHVTREELAAALYSGEPRKCGRNGVKVGKVNYWHPDLAMYTGSYVTVRTLLKTDSEVSVYTLKGEFICNAVGNFFLESGDLDRDIARKTWAHRKSLEAMAVRGLHEVDDSPEHAMMLSLNGGVYNQGEVVDVDEYLDAPQTKGELPEPEPEKETRTKKNRYRDLLDVRTEDYLT